LLLPAVFNGDSLLQLDGMPRTAQNLPNDKDEALAAGVILDVRQCSYCGLVQLFNDPVPYYKDVIRSASFSPSMIARQHEGFKTFIDRFSLTGKNILEVGSGCGEYLSILRELPVNVYGMEHNAEYCRIAAAKGLKTFQAYPTDLTKPPGGIVYDAFVSINFLEHAPDPGTFLRACANFLSVNGVGMIAVPDFEFELNENYLFSFMSDHLAYFSVESLHNLLTLNGFEVTDIFRNQNLNVVTAYFKNRDRCDIGPPMEKYADFNRKINGYMDSILFNGGRIALWGASHLAFSVISASKTKDKISYIVDSAPFKQGKFAPASGLKIFPPQRLAEDPVDSIIILCPEYSDEIVAGIRENFSEIVCNIATFNNGGLEIIQ